jgi:signal transduction histidine kinase
VPTADDHFSRLVSLACHDLRTPLATVYGFARTLSRMEDQDERTTRFLGMIEEAAEQLTELLDELGAAARIEGHRWEPALRDADTLELARAGGEQITVDGRGAIVQTDVEAVERALRALATAAIRYGPVDQVAWHVDGNVLELTPITADAGPVVVSESLRDLGAAVARLVIEALGGSVELDGETLRVRL